MTFEELEVKLGARLPHDFRELHDGFVTQALDNLDLLGLPQIADEWEQAREFADDPESPEPDAVAGVRPGWWSSRWIPFGLLYGSTDFLCLDLDPGAGGAIGQVIHASPKLGPTRVVAASYTEFRRWLDRAIDDDIDVDTILR